MRAQNEALERVVEGKEEMLGEAEVREREMVGENEQLRDAVEGAQREVERMQREVEAAEGRGRHSREFDQKVLQLNEQVSTLLLQVEQLMGEN